ncbi:MAG: glycosyl hydrolase 53 family protein [Lachnospiraceae bacterium]|nr:glycosyl hydrolase 53 family protein [Lachnospiraceae bacterium]
MRKGFKNALCAVLTVAMAVPCVDYGLVARAASLSVGDDVIVNGDFSTDIWDSSGTWSVGSFSDATLNTEACWVTKDTALHMYTEGGGTEFTLSQSVELDAGTYTFAADIIGSGFSVSAAVGSDTGSSHAVSSESAYTEVSDSFTVSSEGTYTFYLYITDTSAGAWGYIDDVSLTLTTAASTSTTTESTAVLADIAVDKVSNLNDDFIMGVDISSYISELESGVTYSYTYGNQTITVDENSPENMIKILALGGVNYIRVRVWVDPADSDGKSYGGGHNDVATAVKIAQAIVASGYKDSVKMLVDFHYSDFWTDPGKQYVPKAWSSYTTDQKATAVGEFTKSALNSIMATGVTVGMVQIGNETTTGICGETYSDWSGMAKIFNAGAAAVREIDKDILIAVHFTNPEKTSTIEGLADSLNNYSVDYDVFATSYYPYWHGSLSNLTTILTYVSNTYGKKVMVAETSYANTMDDTDGHGNTISESSDVGDYCSYSFTVQGQAREWATIVDAVNDVNTNMGVTGSSADFDSTYGIGVFYWEPAWITVGDTTGLTGTDFDERYAANQTIWETYGSGWASSYSGGYDSDAGTWYGGSAVDNQALFGADGVALSSIQMFNYARTGSYVDDSTIGVESIDVDSDIEIEAGESVTFPSTVSVTYTDDSKVSESVTWTGASAVDTDTVGEYEVTGYVTFSKTVSTGTYAGLTGADVSITVTVVPYNMLKDIDSANYSFESGSTSAFSITNMDVKYETANAYDGNYSLHWYQSSATTVGTTYGGASGTGIALEAGTYTFEAMAQGYAGDTVTMSATDGSSTLATGDAETLTGWQSWKTPSVTFTLDSDTTVYFYMEVGVSDGGWGNIDCLKLYGNVASTYTVSTYSMTTGGVTGVATLTGGGAYSEGSSVTVTAPEVDAMEFAGWYAYSGSSYTGSALSTDLAYTFTVSEDTALAAVYDASGSRCITVIDGDSQESSYYEIGTEFSVTAQSEDGFAYWINDAGSIMSTSATYTFTVVYDRTIEAVYGDSDTVLVNFISGYDQIVESLHVSSVSAITLPDGPAKTGYDFAGWSLDKSNVLTSAELSEAFDEALSGDKILNIYAIYTVSSDKVSITIINGSGQETEEYTVNDVVSAVADEVDGQTFSYWMSGSTILSYNSTYKFFAYETMTLTAVYDADTIEDAATAIIADVVENSDGSASFVSILSAPSDASEVVIAGIIASKTSSDFDESSADYVRGLSTTSTSIRYTWTYGFSTSSTIYVKAYMVYKDAQGNLHTVVGDVVSQNEN